MSELALRIGMSWISIRRSASASSVRDYLFGVGDDALEQGQMDTLDHLAHQPSIRMSELADLLRVDPSTATRAVQRLVAAGLAARTPGTEDARVVNVAITAAGRARYDDVRLRRDALMHHMLNAFDEPERDVLADLLERFVGAMDAFAADHVSRRADDVRVSR